jgi:TPR repeat protein
MSVPEVSNSKGVSVEIAAEVDGMQLHPAFLDGKGIYRMLGNRQLALSWYRRASDLGDAEAAQLLQKLESR